MSGNLRTASENAIRAASRRAVRGHRFYVTVKDAGRTGFLLGPFDSRPEACKHVERGRALARKHDAWAAFYTFGTSSLPPDAEIATVFGS